MFYLPSEQAFVPLSSPRRRIFAQIAAVGLRIGKVRRAWLVAITIGEFRNGFRGIIPPGKLPERACKKPSSRRMKIFHNNWRLERSASGESLRQEQPASSHFVLQVGREMINIGRGNGVRDSGFEERHAIALYRITTHLQKQRLHYVRIEFLGGEADDLAQTGAQRNRFTIGSFADHGVESVCQPYNANSQRYLFH